MVILGMSRARLGVLFGVIDGRLMEDLVHLVDIRPETGLPYQEPMGALVDDLLLVDSLIGGVDGGETIVRDEKGLVTGKGVLDEGIEGGGVVGFPLGRGGGEASWASRYLRANWDDMGRSIILYRWIRARGNLGVN